MLMFIVDYLTQLYINIPTLKWTQDKSTWRLTQYNILLKYIFGCMIRKLS